MPSQTRTKAPDRKGKSKYGRRASVKVKPGRDIPLLPIAVGGILAAVFIGLIVYAVLNNGKPALAAGIPCDQGEQTQIHYHASLQIMYQGTLTPIPANIGIQNPAAPTCFYWLHVHAANQDVIHIESPASRTFTLGDFFAVWTAWSQSNGGPAMPLDSKHVATFTLTSDQTLTVYVDATKFTGDPSKIVLKSHEVITLEIGPPTVDPPPAFTFASGL